MTRRVWVDGLQDGGIPGDDPGLLLGLTVFETLRTYGGVPFRLDRHLDRLAASAQELDIALPPRDVMAQEIGSKIDCEARVRYTCTAGGHRVVDVEPIDESQVGADKRVARVRWDPSPWLPGAVKHGSRAAWQVAARRLGVDEVVLVDSQGHLLEASRSNVFAVLDGVLVTPPLDGRFLSGVTRGALLEAADRAGIGVRQAALPSDGPFQELYLSSTLKHLAPVTGLDGQPGPGGGPVGAALLAAFHDLIRRETSTTWSAPDLAWARRDRSG
jgi:branched-chain amino acid aminotransferase